MLKSEAVQRILEHSGLEVSEHRTGLVGSLRPYRGLQESDFVDLVVAIGEWHRATRLDLTVDRRVPTALFCICNRIRGIALRPEGAICRDRLISAEEIIRVSQWATALETMSERCLYGLERPVCWTLVCEYIATTANQDINVYGPLLPMIREAAEFDDTDVSATAKKALSRLMRDD